MSNKAGRSSIIASLLWKLLERGGTQGVQFIIQIILARLLLPEDFGLIAIVIIFTTLAGVFVQSGLNTALIQKKKADNIDFSSVFYLSLLVAGLLYVLLFFFASVIANFYEMPQLKPIIRVLSITLFIGAFNSIQHAFVARNMLFKKLFFSSLGAAILSGTIGIGMAYSGFGVWALVVQQLVSQITVSIILWYTVKWRPALSFSFSRVKVLFSYGWKLLTSALIDNFYRELSSLIIGKIYTPAMLGFYNRGQQIPKLIIANINGSIQSVIFPVLASQQDDKKRMKQMMRRAIITSSFIVFPMMAGLAVVAEPLVTILLTEKWLPAVPFIQIFSVSFALWPIHTANLQAINAIGRSDIFLKLEIIKKIIGLTILGISIPYGIYAIALGNLISGVISSSINAYPNRKLLNYSYFEQLKDIMPSFAISFIMALIVYSINWFGLNVWLTLIIEVCLGVIIYIGLAKIFKLESFGYLIRLSKQILKKKKLV